MTALGSFIKHAIEDNIIDDQKDIENRLASVEAKDGRDATIADTGDRVTYDPNGETIIAGAYPSEGYIQWASDDLLTLVGKISGDHSISTTPISSGLRVIGQAKQAGEIGIVYFIANDENGLAAGGFLNIRSNGEIYMGTDGAGTGTAKPVTLQAGTTATNTVQEALTVTLNTTGTAAAGLGTGLGLWAESAGGTLRKVGSLIAKFLDATDAAEYSRASFLTLVRGANVEKMFSGIVYSSNARTNISVVGNTTVFSIAVPAYYFVAGFLRFSLDAWVDQNASNRTLTGTLTVGATSAVVALGGGGANVLTLWDIEGSVGRGGTNVQDLFVTMESVVDNSSTVTKNGEYEAAAETESGAITVSLTLGLSGTVDAGWFNNVVVEAVDAGNTW